MGSWDYVPEEKVRVTAGDHRLEVVSAEEKKIGRASCRERV